MKTNYSIVSRRISALFVLLLVLCGLSFSPQSAEAQPGKYSLLSFGSGTPFTASNGANIGGIQAGNFIFGGAYAGSYSNGQVISSVPINFNFAFKGAPATTYQTAYIYANGLVTLNGTSANPKNNVVGQSVTVPHFGLFWQNNASTGNGVSWMGGIAEQLRYETVGVAPNRVFVINFYDWVIRRYGDGQRGENRAQYQLRLYEQGQVEYYYDFISAIVPSISGQNANGTNPTAGAIGFGLGPNSEISVQPNGINPPTVSKTSYFQSINVVNSPMPGGTLYVFDQPPNRQLTTSPKILNYGTQVAATSTQLFVTACNTADASAPLIITSAVISASNDYKITTPPATTTLAPGQCVTYGITFTPSRGGTRNGILTITTNGNDSGTQSIVLTGFATVADMTFDSLFLFRNTRTKLADTLIQCIHIKSIGTSPLVFTTPPPVSGTPTFTGVDGNQYLITHMPAAPVPPGTTDSICVAYIPTLEGRRGATLNIASNSLTFPTIAIPLFGYGVLPHIVVTPNPLMLFDSTAEGDTVCKNLTISNTGSDTLRLSANFLSAGEGDFIYPPLKNGLQNIAPDQTRTIEICFHPLQAGTRQATLTIRTNIPKTFDSPPRDTGGTIMIQLRGTGVPLGVFAQSLSGPPTLDSIPVGKTVCRMDTLCNKGDADILVTGFTIGGTNKLDFSQTGLPVPPFTLKARSCIAFSVCGTPAQAGLRIGSFTFTGKTGERTISSTIPAGVFGLTVCVAAPATLFSTTVLPNTGTADSILCFNVVNCGQVSDTYTAKISGANATDYSIISQTPPGSIPPGDTQVICLKYKPAALGPSPASLDITPSVAAKTSVVLGGSAGCAQVTATNDFPTNTFTFTPVNFSVTVTNTGTFTWTSGNVVVTPNTEFAFVSADPPIGTLPNQTVKLHFKFLAKTTGTYTAQITFPNAGPCTNPITVDLSATVAKGSVAPTTQDGFSLEQTYPNPTQGKATFTYTTPRECEVKIELVDMTGRVLENLVNGSVSGGEYTVSFDASKYPSGTYIYMLESGPVKLTRQLILTK